MFEIDGVVYTINLMRLNELYSAYAKEESETIKLDSGDLFIPSAKHKMLDILTLMLEKVLNEDSPMIVYEDSDSGSDGDENKTTSYKLAFNTLLENGVITYRNIEK